ncbi:MAG: prolipoprotein diacylglyceryl transferase [Actinomycetota bacterium]
MFWLAAIGWRVIDRFRFGPIEISPHGIGIAAGFLAGGSLLARRAERILGIRKEHTWNMLMWAIVGVIIGARLAFVIGNPDLFFPDDPLGVFRIWEGGVALYGGIFGGILAAIPYQRKHGLPSIELLDAAAPGFPLGIAIGRIGDLIIGDHLGSSTDFFLGYRYLGGPLPDRTLAVGEVVHQTALYDMLIAAIIFPVVMVLSRRHLARGRLIAMTAMLYAAGRFVTDFSRTEVASFGGLYGTQWTSIALILAGAAWLSRRPRRGYTLPLDQPLHEPAVIADDEPDLGGFPEEGPSGVGPAPGDASGDDPVSPAGDPRS